jgi:hypothetical protein
LRCAAQRRFERAFFIEGALLISRACSGLLCLPAARACLCSFITFAANVAIVPQFPVFLFFHKHPLEEIQALELTSFYALDNILAVE